MEIVYVDKFTEIPPSDNGYIFKEGKSDDEIVACIIIDQEDIEYRIKWAELRNNMWQSLK